MRSRREFLTNAVLLPLTAKAEDPRQPPSSPRSTNTYPTANTSAIVSSSDIPTTVSGTNRMSLSFLCTSIKSPKVT
jgi:hypothetical protein